MIKDVAYWTTAKRLAEKLYVASYGPDVDVSKIEPLRMRAKWQRELWLRVADAALTETRR